MYERKTMLQFCQSNGKYATCGKSMKKNNVVKVFGIFLFLFFFAYALVVYDCQSLHLYRAGAAVDGRWEPIDRPIAVNQDVDVQSNVKLTVITARKKKESKCHISHAHLEVSTLCEVHSKCIFSQPSFLKMSICFKMFIYFCIVLVFLNIFYRETCFYPLCLQCRRSASYDGWSGGLSVSIHSLIYEVDVRTPHLVGRNPQNINVVIFLWVP